MGQKGGDGGQMGGNWGKGGEWGKRAGGGLCLCLCSCLAICRRRLSGNGGKSQKIGGSAIARQPISPGRRDSDSESSDSEWSPGSCLTATEENEEEKEEDPK